MINTIEELTSIYLQHRNGLFACALAVTRRQDLAEDAIHDAFARLYKNGNSIRVENGLLKAYVYRSVRNAAIDLVRGRRGDASLNGYALFDASDGPAEQAQQAEFQQCVSDALLLMPQSEREVIVQRLYANLAFHEIAAAMEAPIGTVSSWYHRGMERLREQLKVHNE